MTVLEIANTLGYEIVAGESGAEKVVTRVYTCDLLSFAMGRAPADSAWVTVMGNVNAVAVASLADVACIVLAENVRPDEMATSKAQQEGIPILISPDAIFETGKKIDELL